MQRPQQHIFSTTAAAYFNLAEPESKRNLLVPGTCRAPQPDADNTIDVLRA
jgi:hypothetical protein